MRNLPSSPVCDLWRGRIITSMQRMFKVSLPSTHSYISNFCIHFQACALSVALVFSLFFFFLHTLTISASRCVCIQYISFSLSLSERLLPAQEFAHLFLSAPPAVAKRNIYVPKGHSVVFLCFSNSLIVVVNANTSFRKRKGIIG